MKISILKKPVRRAFSLRVFTLKYAEVYLLFGLLALLWVTGTRALESDPMAAAMDDRNLYLLIIMSLICFLGLLSLCWWLLQIAWRSLKLPAINSLVMDFKDLELWQQLGFVWASFALLLLAAVGSLMAIC